MHDAFGHVGLVQDVRVVGDPGVADLSDELLGPAEITLGRVVAVQGDDRPDELHAGLVRPGQIEGDLVVRHGPWVGVAGLGHGQERPSQVQVGLPEPGPRQIVDAVEEVDGGGEVLIALGQRPALAGLVRGRFVRRGGVDETVGGTEMGGDRAPGDAAALTPLGDQCLGHLSVHQGALLIGHEVVGHVADQDVAEPVGLVRWCGARRGPRRPSTPPHVRPRRGAVPTPGPAPGD